MADIIDEFLVSLNLDTSQYDKEIRKYRDDRKRLTEEEQKQNRVTQDGQSRTVAGLRQLRNETAGFLLMLAGATSLVGFAKDMLTADAATGRFARNTGMATERVSVWENALKRVGGTAEEARAALGTLFSIFQNYQLMGDLSKGGALAFFGLSERDLKDPEAALLRIAEVVKNLPREDVEARLATLGLSGSIVGLLAGDRGELTKLLASVEAAGVANDDSAEAAMNLEAEMARTAQTIQGVARPAISDLANVVVKLTDTFNDLLQPLAATRDWFDSFTDSNIFKLITGGDYKNFWDYLGDAAGGEIGERLKRNYGNEGRGQSSGGGSGMIGGMIDYALGAMTGGGGPQGHVTAGPTGGRPRGRLTRAERNNNPGNIEDGPFARRQYGYVGGDGRFAKFSSADAGFAAMENLLRGRGYAGGGRNTIAKIIAKYAPASENNVGAYASAVERATGISRHKPLTPAEIRAVSRAMARHEGYRGGLPGASPGSAYVGRRGPSTNRADMAAANQMVTTTIGAINIYTPAANADGIARDIRSEMTKRGLVVQAGSGLRP